MIVKQLERAAHQNNLDILEQIKDVIITPDPFSLKNGTLTDSRKLRRKQIKKEFETQLNQLYEKVRNRGVVFD